MVSHLSRHYLGPRRLAVGQGVLLQWTAKESAIYSNSGTTYGPFNARRASSFPEAASYLGIPGVYGDTGRMHIHDPGEIHTFSVLALILMNACADVDRRASPLPGCQALLISVHAP